MLINGRRSSTVGMSNTALLAVSDDRKTLLVRTREPAMSVELSIDCTAECAGIDDATLLAPEVEAVNVGSGTRTWEVRTGFTKVVTVRSLRGASTAGRIVPVRRRIAVQISHRFNDAMSTPGQSVGAPLIFNNDW